MIVDRFDRLGQARIGYVSALTMLERADGEAGSYLEIADVIVRHSPSAGDDLRELWRRIAFSVLSMPASRSPSSLGRWAIS